MRPDMHVVFWIVVFAVSVVLVSYLSDALLPFAFGAAIAYFLNPLAVALQRAGLGRTLASALIIGAAALALTAAAVLLLPLAADQLRRLVEALPGDLERIRGWIEAMAEQHLGASFPGFKVRLERALGELAQGSTGLIGDAAKVLWSRGQALINLVSLVLVTPVVAFYLLRDWPAVLAQIDGWLPIRRASTIRRLASDIDTAVGAFIRGQGTICIILGAFYALALTALGLRYGLLIGIATGVLAFVPLVGWVLGLTVALVVALTQSWPDATLALQVIGVFGAAMVLDSALLSPLIVGQRVGLHPVSLMLALFVFSALFGLLGTLVAVPVAAALAVLVRFARDRYLESSLYLGAGPPTSLPGSAPRLDT
ncbi:MAG: AI-2E family transporter [Hyphomicrobiaceae bacterium]